MTTPWFWSAAIFEPKTFKMKEILAAITFIFFDQCVIFYPFIAQGTFLADHSILDDVMLQYDITVNEKCMWMYDITVIEKLMWYGDMYVIWRGWYENALYEYV